MNDRVAKRVERPPTPDDAMSKDEKEDFEQEIEEFEGPDPGADPDTHKESSDEPGVSRS